jgi:hypothetical protein
MPTRVSSGFALSIFCLIGTTAGKMDPLGDPPYGGYGFRGSRRRRDRGATRSALG